MANTWKQASKDYKKHLYERHLLEEIKVPLTENDFNLAAFKRNPERFFDENGWIVPEKHFEEITVALAELAQSDSEISPEEVELGRKGKKVQEIVQELAKRDKRFADIMKMVSKKNHLTEGKGKRVLAASLVCLAILLGTTSCSTLAYEWNRVATQELYVQDANESWATSMEYPVMVQYPIGHWEKRTTTNTTIKAIKLKNGEEAVELTVPFCDPKDITKIEKFYIAIAHEDSVWTELDWTFQYNRYEGLGIVYGKFILKGESAKIFLEKYRNLPRSKSEKKFMIIALVGPDKTNKNISKFTIYSKKWGYCSLKETGLSLEF